MTEATTALGVADIQKIMACIPHRYPFLLVDRVVEMNGDESGIGIKNVTVNEPQFTGHFPGRPVFPGVLMIEAMAQTAALLSFKTMGIKPDESSVVYFVGIDNARFKRPVGPGDQLKMDVEIVRNARGIWKYKAVGSVDGQVAVEADLMCTIRNVADASQQPAGN